MEKQLFNEHILFKELHPTLNQDVDFSKVYETSIKKVTWQCTKDSRHVWEQAIRSRTKQGYGCSYCSGHKTLHEESLGSLHPHISSEVHKEKNPNFDAFSHSPQSNKVVNWICPNGHEWKSKVFFRTRNQDPECPTCRKRKTSFASKYPNLVKEWHATKNNNLDPWELTPSSKNKIWWVCSVLEHPDWEDSITMRANSNRGCPECKLNNKKTNKVKVSLPLLSVYSSELSKQWHPTKNKENLPSQFTAGSIYKAWWLCSSCNKEWQSTIANRARLNRGCPSCARRKKGKKGNKIGASIVQTHPILIPMWHENLNKELKPEQFTYGSSKEIWWQCLTNKDHVWLEKINVRTKRKSTECKICEVEANSLQTNYPDIAAEWHPTRNGSLTPKDVSQAAGQKIWWQCLVNPEHVWRADVRNRTLNKSNCNQCSIEKTSIHLRNPGQVIDSRDVNTYHIFTSSMESLLLLLEHSLENNKRLIQPMYRIVSINKSNKELNTKKYSIEEVVDWHRNVELKVIEFLSNLIWHNIYNVKTLYKDTLNISFPKNTPEIIKAVGIRHDLVHRNGKTKKGKMHVLSKNDVESLLKETTEFVSEIQKQLIKIDM